MQALKKYLIIFLILNIVFAVAYALISYFLHINLGQGIINTAISAWVAGMTFCKDHRRLPSKEEKKSLINGSFIIAIILTVIGIGLMSLGNYMETGTTGIENMNSSLLIVSLLIGLGLTYLILWVSYGWLLNFTGKRMLTKLADQETRK